MRTALCLLIDSWLWLFFFLRALTYCVLKNTHRAKGNARLNTAEEQKKNHFQMQMCSGGFFELIRFNKLPRAGRLIGGVTIDENVQNTPSYNCTNTSWLHLIGRTFSFSWLFAPEFQTWPTWQLVWKYSRVLVHRKHFKWETSHVVAESVFILDRQRLV